MAHSVLIVDDDKDIADVMAASLELHGYRSKAVYDARNGFVQMVQFHPDIVLVDWEMPEIDGIEFIKELRKNPAYQNLYIIIVTGHSETVDIIEGLNAGADDYLSKPFQLEVLIALIRSGIRIRELDRRIAEGTKQLSVLESALSIVDKISNPVEAAKLYSQLMLNYPEAQHSQKIQDTLTTITSILDEALQLIRQYQSVKNNSDSGAKTIIATKISTPQ